MKLITRKFKLKDVIDKKTVKALSGYGVTKDSEFLRKGLEVSDITFDEGERAAVTIITTSRPDRDRDIVMPNGGVLDHFLKHPIVLSGHDYSDTVGVGMAAWLKLTGDGSGIISKTKFHTNKKADDIYQWSKDGFPTAVSIGFIPLEGYSKGEKEFNQHAKEMISKGWITKDDIENTDRIFVKWILLEYSYVTVPSNYEALQLAVSKNFMPGYDSPLEIEESDPVKEITDYQDKPGERKFMIVDEAQEDKEDASPIEKDVVVEIDYTTEDGQLHTEEHMIPIDVLGKLTQTKTIDADKQPSVHDIHQAIYFTLNNNSLVNDSHSHIIDLYPVDYPNGHAVIAMYIENMDGSISQERYVDWQYTMADGVATLMDAVEVNEQWAVKGLTQELKKQLGVKVEKTFTISPSPKKKTVNKEEAMAIVKAGITANVNSVNDSVGQMIADANKDMKTKIALAQGHVVYKE